MSGTAANGYRKNVRSLTPYNIKKFKQKQECREKKKKTYKPRQLAVDPSTIICHLFTFSLFSISRHFRCRFFFLFFDRRGSVIVEAVGWR